DRTRAETEPAAGSVHQDQGEAHDDRRDRDREVDDRVQQPSTDEPVAYQQDRGSDAEDRVDRGRDSGDGDRTLERGDRVRIRDRTEEGADARTEGPPDEYAD